jgi:hypothetical protein
MKYRKPRTINWVTFMLLGMVGLVVYVTVYMWPVYATRSRVKGILLDLVPALYKANLRPDDVSRVMIEEIKLSFAEELKKAGINDKGVKLFLRRNPKEVELEARFKVKARFPWPDKTYEFELSPKVVSDATRVDW